MLGGPGGSSIYQVGSLSLLLTPLHRTRYGSMLDTPTAVTNASSTAKGPRAPPQNPAHLQVPNVSRAAAAARIDVATASKLAASRRGQAGMGSGCFARHCSARCEACRGCHSLAGISLGGVGTAESHAAELDRYSGPASSHQNAAPMVRQTTGLTMSRIVSAGWLFCFVLQVAPPTYAKPFNAAFILVYNIRVLANRAHTAWKGG